MPAYFPPVALPALPELEILFPANSNYAQSGRKCTVLARWKMLLLLCVQKLNIVRGTRNMKIGDIQLPNKLDPSLLPDDTSEGPSLSP